MDIFDPMHVCNHTDEEGRYAYEVAFPLLLHRRLVNALLPVPTKYDVSDLD